MLRRPRGTRARVAMIVVASGVALQVVSSPANAQATDPAAAQSLFDEAKRLMEAKDFAAACPKLAESQRLDPAPGTVIALALCHEGEGRTATAWAEFNQALSDARRDKRADREAAAAEHIRALEPRLVRVRLVVTQPVDGIEVRRDGLALGTAQWSVPVAVDPGTYTFAATAPGKEPFETTVNVTEEGSTVDVVIPALRDAESVAAPPVPAPAAAPAPAARDDASVGDTQRTWGLVLGGVGLVSAAVGAGFGIHADAKWSDAERACPSNRCPSTGASQAGRDAGTAADVSTALFVASGLALAGGAILYFAAPRATKPAAGRLGIGPWASGTGAGAFVGGAL